MSSPLRILGLGLALSPLFAAVLNGCKTTGDESPAAPHPQSTSAVASPSPAIPDDALPPERTGGFDGQRAYALVAKQVSFGPRPSGSPAIFQLQEFLQAELKSYGCKFEVDSFSADTPDGRLPMKNILVKIPGEKPGIILLGTHYDTKHLENFVGADDAGSSTGLMLELARLLCPQHGKYNVWIAFFDGEEAVKEWSDTDSRYGSRQMAARFAAHGELTRIKGFLLADIVGGRTARFQRESNSTPALVDLVWTTSAKLGYSAIFPNEKTSAEDDHDSFLKRGVPSVDVIGDFLNNGYWHTPQDALDKISAKSLGVVGHVFLESVKTLQSK
jgi:glutaminyl-peptide cyclotransferase